MSAAMLGRLRLDRSSLRLQEWPQIDDRVLADAAQATFRLRRDALRAYVGGTPMSEVEALGVDRRTLHRLVARALRPHADGRNWGLCRDKRGLVRSADEV